MDAMYIIGEVIEVELNSYPKKETGEIVTYTEVTMHYDYRDSKGKRRMDTEKFSVNGDKVAELRTHIGKWVAFPHTKRNLKDGLMVFPDGESDIIVFGESPHKKGAAQKAA